jgi:SAM-dependent methyltransferase
MARRWLLFLAGFSILFWELALIRWIGACIRITAYYSNFILLAAFFGLGAGALLSRQERRIEAALMPALSVLLLIAVGLSGVHHSNVGSTQDEFVWIGAPLGLNPSSVSISLPPVVVLTLAYVLAAGVFAVFGAWLGRLFRGHRPLIAYSVEVAGSMAGIVAFGLLSALQVGPLVWFGIGFVLLLPTLPQSTMGRVAALCCAVVALSASAPYALGHVWSPYYKILHQPLEEVRTLDGGRHRFERPVGRVIQVNNDYHQMMLDLAPHDAPEHPFLTEWRALYDIPYQGADALPPGPILVVGAGSGNDVAAALRNTDREVVAVDIDPAIVELGRQHHPERPYDNPRVQVVINDARSMFQGTDRKFALVVFGFLDSHTLVSSYSSLRLDNFVYTVDAIERVRELLVPGGRAALTFAANTKWLDRRLAGMLDVVFGDVQVTRAEGRYPNGKVYIAHRPAAPSPVDEQVVLERRLPTDDWPFLYLARPSLPSHYVAFLAIALLLAIGALFLLPRGSRRIRLPFFFLGAGFFLVETSNVVSLSLLFGSTWTVNLLVFGGVLVLVLLGNLTALKLDRTHVSPAIALLAANVMLAWSIEPADLLEVSSLALRSIAAVVVFLGPAYFSAYLFASLIKDEPDLYRAYGSNMLGSVVGGALEYASLLFGFSFLLALTMLCYLAVFVTLRSRRS